MARPAKSVVYKAKVDALFGLAEPTRTVGAKVMEGANTVHGTITNLDWESVAKDAAVGRADRELAQDKRVVLGYNALADAYHNGSVTMQPMIADLTKAAQGLEADTYDVSEDWAVTDKYDYQAGRIVMRLKGYTREEADARMNKLQAERGAEAKTETVKLQRQADDLGHADQETADAITKATGDIKDAAPPLAGLSGGDLAANDIRDIAAGKGTPEEKARVRAAMSSWTPEEVTALAQGKPATMPQGQYDYLKSLMRGMDGMSVVDINRMMSENGLQGPMGDTIRMMGNPNVQTANGDHGSLDNEPQAIRTLLTSDPTSLWNSGAGHGQMALMVPLNEYNALNALLEHGDPGTRAGSDVDRALLNQASRITHALDAGHPYGSITSPHNDHRGFDNVSMHDVNLTVSGMIANGSNDHQAVTDFLTAAAHSSGASDSAAKLDGPIADAAVARMNAATNGHFDGNQAFLDLATHKFDDVSDGGMKGMFGWMGASAHAPGLEGWDAAASANATAHLLSNDHDLLGGGVKGHEPLGRINPGIVQTMTENLIPYLGNLNGVPTPGIQGDAIPSFIMTDDLAHMIEVLDSDPASANAINGGVAAWEQHFAYEFGATGDPKYAEATGRFTQAVEDGNRDELVALQKADNTAALKAYQGDSQTWDTAKTILAKGIGSIPVIGSVMSLGLDLASPWLKEPILDVGTDEAAMRDSAKWTSMLDQTDKNFQKLTDGEIRTYDITQGYLSTHHNAWAQFQNVSTVNGPINFLDSNGNVDWSKVNQYPDKFNEAYLKLKANDRTAFDGWDDPNVGYEGGKKNPYIDKTHIPNPGDPRTAPGG